MSTHDDVSNLGKNKLLTFTPHCHTVREAKGGHVPPVCPPDLPLRGGMTKEAVTISN